MIKELVQFTESLEEEFKAVGIAPKEGLHIILNINNPLAFKKFIYRKKKTQLTELIRTCAIRTEFSWMFDSDTNKCIDKKTKAVHSCSPYCLAIKRTNLENGENFTKRTKENKPIVYDSLKSYFDEAQKLNVNENLSTQTFSSLLDTKDKIHYYLNQIDEYEELKNDEYIIFYADVSTDKYQKAYGVYVLDKLFTTNQYNIPKGEVALFTSGVSSFFNGVPDKKPFLTHQTATFNIGSRILASDGLKLLEFKQLIGRNILPNPLPIFIYEDERKELNLALFKREALEDGAKRGFKEIIKEVQSKLQKELGNYYLLFYQRGEIKDFDFVSRFEYHLKNEKGEKSAWEVKNLFLLKVGNETKGNYFLENVFDLFWGVFNIVIGDKYNKADNFFDDLKEENYKDNDGGKNDLTLMAFRKYRRAIYNYVYKSRRQEITGQTFKEIMIAGIKDDLKYNRPFKIMEKLNIFFSLNHHFDIQNINFNGYYMPDKLEQLLTKTMEIADSSERVAISDETEFAFISGQIIDFLFDKSKSADNSHVALEGFLQKADARLFKNEIARLFHKYLHAIERDDNGRVKRLMREIMAFDKEADMRKLMTFVLAGYFSPSFYFTKKKVEATNS